MTDSRNHRNLAVINCIGNLFGIKSIKVIDPKPVRGRTILLLDDVMATGSTLSECAKTLKEAGAWRVWAVTLARSVR